MCMSFLSYRDNEETLSRPTEGNCSIVFHNFCDVIIIYIVIRVDYLQD